MSDRDPDKTPIPGTPSRRLDPALMATKQNPCECLTPCSGLRVYGHWKNGASVDLNASDGRTDMCTRLSPDDARRLAEDLIEMAFAVEAVADAAEAVAITLAARTRNEGGDR
jgi:hypothetical protein